MGGSRGFDDAGFVKEFVFDHVLVQLENHVFESLRILKLCPKDALEFIEAAIIQILHVSQIVARLFDSRLLVGSHSHGLACLLRPVYVDAERHTSSVQGLLRHLG